MSCNVPGLEDVECLFIFGYNPNTSHPVITRRISRAKEKGAKIIVADPRFIETARIADIYMPLRNGSNVAFLNAFANAIVTEGVMDVQFVKEHTVGFEQWWKTIKNYTPEAVQDITGIDPATMRAAARMYATAKSAVIFWGMGVCQHRQNVEAVEACAAICTIAHQIGKPNCGVAPVRGQNNVQGACDMGAMREYYVGYQKVTDPAIRKKFADHWNVPFEDMPANNGYPITLVGDLIDQGVIHGFYNFGEDPLQTDPDTSHLREKYKKLDILICQDIFMTQTASQADVIFPATSWGEHEGTFVACDRTVQYFSQALPPKGECRHDWQIICDLAAKMGYEMSYENPEDIWNREAREMWPAVKGITYERLAGLGALAWPCPDENGPDTPTNFLGGKFSFPDGKARLIAHDFEYPTEMPDATYPLVLVLVREVGHYSCRSMTGNCKTLAKLWDEPGFVQMNPEDAAARGIQDGDVVRVRSRRNEIFARAEVTDRINRGAIYMTYQWWIGKADSLGIDQLDEEGSFTPESKYCAAEVVAIPDQLAAAKQVQKQYMDLKEYLAKAASGQYGDGSTSMADYNEPPFPDDL